MTICSRNNDSGMFEDIFIHKCFALASVLFGGPKQNIGGYKYFLEIFTKIFNYISGSNVGENDMKMTMPVNIKIKKLNADSFEEEVCLYLDNVHQANPPQPTNSDVHIVNRPAMNIYTRLVQIALLYLIYCKNKPHLSVQKIGHVQKIFNVVKCFLK